MKPLICNLKMNHTYDDMIKYKAILGNINYPDLVICPSFPYLQMMKASNYVLCAQNVSSHLVGSFTGEVSAASLKSIGVSAALIGHVETKTSYDEVSDKLHQVLRQDMIAYVILTDTLDDYNYQYTSSVLLGQIRGLLAHVSSKDYDKIHFIYEPKYMIGKDEALDIGDLESIFSYLKQELVSDYGYSFPLYYGGGLSLSNIMPYYLNDNIDGLFLGKYINHPDGLKSICNKIIKTTTIDKN